MTNNLFSDINKVMIFGRYLIVLFIMLFFVSAAAATVSGLPSAADKDGYKADQFIQASVYVPELQLNTTQQTIQTAAPELKTSLATVPYPAAVAVNEIASIDHNVTMPIAVKAVDRNVSLFSERIKERFSLYLERSGRYLAMMKEILKANNMPEEIAFLPLVESGFNPNAYSVARAVGPWQFIAGTAKRYGLKIDWWMDERKDPVKSTEAAASYLKDLYGMFGSWNLAMAAYNAGEGRILRALQRTKSDDYWSLLKTRHIRNETKEYVPRFIAARMIAVNPGEYGFENLDYHTPFQYDEVVLESPVDLEVAAVCAETSLEAIKELNPELRRWSTPPNMGQYRLRIPSGKKNIFSDNLLKTPEAEWFSLSVHTVKKGETIKSIAAVARIPVSVFLELNGDLRALKTGEKVYLPPKDKFYLDRDDKVRLKKATFNDKGKSRNKKQKSKKLLVTSLNKKDHYIND